MLKYVLKANKNLDALSRAVEGLGPMKSGNLGTIPKVLNPTELGF